jgi:hypothetical protein
MGIALGSASGEREESGRRGLEVSRELAGGSPLQGSGDGKIPFLGVPKSGVDKRPRSFACFRGFRLLAVFGD